MDNPGYNGPDKNTVSSNGHSIGMDEMADKTDKPRFERSMSEPDEETAARREADRARTPFFYCRWIVARPRTSFCICLGLSLFLMFATFGMIAAGVDVIPIVFERLPLDIRDNEFYLRGLSWSFRDDEDTNGPVTIYDRGASAEESIAERSKLREMVIFLYEKPNGNVLTSKRLRAIKKNEDKFFNIKDYKEKFCYMIGPQCAPMRSITQFFDGSMARFGQIFNDTNFDNVEGVLLEAAGNNGTKQMLEYFLPADASIEDGNVKSSIIRSSMAFGFPLNGYNNIEDDDEEEEQQEKLDDFFNDDFIGEGQDTFSDGVGDMEFNYFSGSIFQLYVTTRVYSDMALLGGSLTFIFLFMWFQTRSLFITGFAVLSIVTSFFIANLIYRFVFDYRYFGIFHVLALFIILGIGADDVFVFYDTWRETGHYKFPSLAHRLSYAYRRATFAMLWTSLTTAVAFIVSATSPFLGVSTFGVFAGLLVFVNYMSVIVYFPTVIVMYHLYFSKYKCCCCCPNKTSPEEGDLNKHVSEKKNIIVRFFGNVYFRVITHKIVRWVIVAAYMAILGVFIYYATKLEVQEEQVEFLPRDTNFGGFIAKSNSRFSSGEEPQRIFIVWGLKEQDVDGCHRSDSLCFGETVWDNDFDIQSPEQQNALLNLCDKLENLSPQIIEDLHIRTDIITGTPEVYCFPRLVQEFMPIEQERMVQVNSSLMRRYANETALSYPVEQPTAQTIMNSISNVFTSQLPADFDRWFEVGVDTWLHGGFIPQQTLDNVYDTYEPWVGMEKTDFSVQSEAFENGDLPYAYLYGTRIRYATIVVNTTLKPRDLGFIEGQPIRDKWEDFVKAEMKNMPDGLKNGYQCTPIDFTDFDLWHWLDIQEVLVITAIQGILIGLACALPVLIIATMNIFVGIMATVNIALITLTVIGFIPMMGWKLGFMESLNLVLVVGLAVDYCVHLAEGYSRSKHMHREGRLRDALQEVGISVISGCVTSVGASSFMLFAVIIFFTQFGSFLFATLAFSFFYSIGLFCTCLGIFGPQHDTGSLRVLIDKIKACCCKKKKSTANVTEKYGV